MRTKQQHQGGILFLYLYETRLIAAIKQDTRCINVHDNFIVIKYNIV